MFVLEDFDPLLAICRHTPQMRIIPHPAKAARIPWVISLLAHDSRTALPVVVPGGLLRPIKGESMHTSDTIFQRALSKLLIEIFDGPPGSEAYLLNPGDPGLLRQLESI